MLGAWLAGLLLAAGAAAARAQVAPLEPGRSGADLVLERDDWLALEPLSLEDLLQRAAGIVVLRRGGLGSLELVQVGASQPGRLQLVLDGIDISEPELQWPRLFDVQVSMLRRIEVHRTSDPARILLWTRRPEGQAPSVDFDLGRGSFGTRTRRVQLFTPPRAVHVAVSYEELLRGPQDFRTSRLGDPSELLGAYDGRALLVRIELQRPGDERLRVQYERADDNTHATSLSRFDVARSQRARSELRWERHLGPARFVLAAGHEVWDRDRVVGGVRTEVAESRSVAALDLGGPDDAAARAWLRLRATEISAERRQDGGLQAGADRRYDAELQLGGSVGFDWEAWAGLHRHDVHGTSWSGRARLGRTWGAWELGLEGGRGVSFAAWGESRDAGFVGTRPATYAAVLAARRGRRLQLEARPFYKRLEGGAVGPEWRAELRRGADEVAGALLQAGLVVGQELWRAELRAGGACTPHVHGPESGWPRRDGWAHASLSRHLFRGDLVTTLRTDWTGAAERRLDGFVLAPYVQGDLTLDILVLRRVHVFWSLRDVAEARPALGPGVRGEGRHSLLGIRLRLLD
jgi:hypothetical protein